MKTNITQCCIDDNLGFGGSTWCRVGLVRCEGTELKYGLAIGSILSRMNRCLLSQAKRSTLPRIDG